MVGHCYFRAKLANCFDEVVVATCDKEISDYCSTIDAKCIMTSSSHERASDRSAEAVNILENRKRFFDIIVMLQGDEPMVSPDSLKLIVSNLSDKKVEIVNLISKFLNENDFQDENNVKCTFDKNMNALYFSREGIPSSWKRNNKDLRYNQAGVIGFTNKSLKWFLSSRSTELEKIESVDMNRVLENGKGIKLVKNKNFTLGVDTESDLKKVENWMSKDKTFKLYSQD